MSLNIKGNIISNSDITSVGVFKTRVNRDGLVLFLDAANQDSYPGTGTAWYDLSGNARNAYIRGTVISGTTNGGYFETPANQTATYIELPEAAPQALSDGTVFTLEWWCTMKDTATGRYQMSMVDSVGGNLYIISKDATSFGIWNVSLISGTAPTYTVDVPQQLAVVSIGTNQFFYKNGVLTSVWNLYSSIITTTGFIIDQEQDASKGGFDPAQNTYGWWHVVRMYNRALSAYEIAENFQAERGRFGV